MDAPKSDSVLYPVSVIYLLPRQPKKDAAIIERAKEYGGVLYDIEETPRAVEIWFEFPTYESAGEAGQAFEAAGEFVEHHGCWDANPPA